MSTNIVCFQSDQQLLNGCIHLPDNVHDRKIGVVIVHENTKFGTHGLFRSVANAFAASGFYALRYDNRGTCDSPGDCDLTFDDRVADAYAAAQFLKTEYKLDSILFWGLCLGAAVAVHTSKRLTGRFKPDGMILCSILVDPLDATLPEFNYRPQTVSAYLRNGFLHGSPWHRLREFVSDSGYRTNTFRSLATLARTYIKKDNKLDQMRDRIARIGPLLAQYEGPTLVVYGDTDPYWTALTRRINVGDKLQLAKKNLPPKIAVIVDGDHMFHSVRQTSEVINLSLSWAKALRDGQNVAGQSEEIHAIFAAPAAN
jgi:pimeloyl-ACP methyl ester carboxylesterase